LMLPVPLVLMPRPTLVSAPIVAMRGEDPAPAPVAYTLFAPLATNNGPVILAPVEVIFPPTVNGPVSVPPVSGKYPAATDCVVAMTALAPAPAANGIFE